MDAATLLLGTTIAKLVLRKWIGDEDVAASTADSIVGLINLKTNDPLVQRRAIRQFDEMGERIAEQLFPVFEGQVDEEGRAAVIDIAVLALDSTSTGIDTLLDKNLDESRLYKEVLRRTESEASLLSDAERQFLQLIIRESCQRVIILSSQLPEFSSKSLGELLKRQDYIVDATSTILHEIESIKIAMKDSGLSPDDAQFESSYKLAVAQKLNTLQLFGVDVADENRRQSLSVAYITLSAACGIEAENDSLVGGLDSRSSLDAERLEKSDKHEPIDRAIASSSRWLIRGFAGSGKTTLLQWIAVASATGSFGGALHEWNNSVPFYIALRRFVGGEGIGLPAPELLPGIVAPSVSGTMPAGWVHRQLAAGRGILLVDGMDEVPTQYREDVREWVTELLNSFPETRIIVTSRPHAIDEYWMGSLQFQSAELLPMELPDIYSLIDQWHEAVGEQIRDDEERAGLLDLAANLKVTIRLNRSLRLLATSPLLCAMLCALHRHRRQQLPTDRIELYDACCHMLIERREMERRIPYSDYPILNYRQKLTLLEHFAYWLIKNGHSQASVEDAEACWQGKLSGMGSLPANANPESVRRLLVERTAIVREPSAGTVDFAHRTFQEFLAARAAIDARDIGLLVSKAHDDQWREVIILAAGQAPGRDRNELLRKLISRGDRGRKYRHRVHLLAVACLDTTLEIDSDIRHEIDERLAALIPPKSSEEVRDVASAGDLAVPYLRRVRQSVVSAGEPILTYSIRALVLIGGESALTVLEEYAKDGGHLDPSVYMYAWRGFEPPEEYGRRLVPILFKDRTSVFMYDVPSLEGFDLLYGLRQLGLAIPNVSDLSLLATLRHLEVLRLHDMGEVFDLSPIQELTSLKELTLEELPSRIDTSGLSALSDLEVLRLSSDSILSDPSWGRNLSRLRRLELMGVDSETDLSDLALIPSLQELHLHGNSALQGRRKGGIASPLPIAGKLQQSITSLSGLKAIALTGAYSASLFSQLIGMEGLERMKLVIREPGADIEVSRVSPNLRRLDLTVASHQRISLPQIPTLCDLTIVSRNGLGSLVAEFASEVQSLKTWGGGLPLESFAGLTQLEVLELGGPGRLLPIVAGASYSPSLSDVGVGIIDSMIYPVGGYDAVVDLSTLAEIQKLRELTLWGFESVTDLSVLSSLDKLEVLKLGGFPQVRDFSSLLEIPNLKSLEIVTSQKELVDDQLRDGVGEIAFTLHGIDRIRSNGSDSTERRPGRGVRIMIEDGSDEFFESSIWPSSHVYHAG